jgi:hypothetical protein
LLRWLILLGLLCAPLLAYAGTSNDYLARLQSRAHALHLAQKRYWQLLLEYQSDRFSGGQSSPVTSSWFFNAADGETNPRDELDATLAAFFSAKPVKPRKGPAQCVFIARYHWLNSKLHFDPDRLPRQSCPHFKRWLGNINPESAAVIFPTAYINSPASMFGHTLLRVDGRGQNKGTRLLAYAVNYAAQTNEENGFLFAFKGIFGGYPGRFGLFPYYKKIKQYTRIENRDIWAYQLDLSPREIKRMLRHLWELKGADAPYLFFTRNCSYELLGLLETARPSLHLTDRFHAWVIPSDTLRALAVVPGLVTETDFRPSRQTVLKSEYGQLPAKAQRLARALGKGEIAPIDPRVRALSRKTRARTLDTAYDYASYRLFSGKSSQKQMAQFARKLLLARSRIHVRKKLFQPPPRPSAPPTASHRTGRVNLGYVHEHGHNGIRLGFRGAYHDLLDSSAGYASGAKVDFGHLAFRYDPSQNKLRFEHLTAIAVQSVSPRSALFKPISWQVETGVRWAPARPLFDADHGSLGYYLQGGPGLAYGNLSALTVYGYALGSLDLSPGLRHDARPGVGGDLGLLGRVARGLNLKAAVGALAFPSARDTHKYWASLGGQWQITQNNGLRVTTRYTDTQSVHYFTTEVSWNWYF